MKYTKDNPKLVEDYYDFVENTYHNAISKKISELDKDTSDMVYYNLIKDYQ